MYFVMGYNYVVGVDNAIHSYGHRAESALSLTVGRGFWDGCPGHPGTGPSDFDRYTCTDKNKVASPGVNVAGVGSVHVPPNGLTDYDYGNITAPTLTSENCSAWGCNQQGYIVTPSTIEAAPPIHVAASDRRRVSVRYQRQAALKFWTVGPPRLFRFMTSGAKLQRPWLGRTA
jgi:hypothetical protein